MNNFGPIHPKMPAMLHGGDYNPDQWQHIPEIIDEDFRLMDLAHANAMSVGIFAWTALEPEEGVFTFDWLDDIMDRLAASGKFAILATPSGARPAWMSQKYPEVLRVQMDRTKNLHGGRHNHCYTSPIYREKVRIINASLADRYKDHPALLVFHLSNEYGGDCHCELCQEAFRTWLKEKYNHDLDALNKAWWTAFWSHTYTDWSQVESPAPQGETTVHGHNLDWRRFVTAQTTDFMQAEIAPLKRIAPDIPVTSNFMGTYDGLDYWKMAPDLDVISWDSYPTWHESLDETDVATFTAFSHDINRCLKQGKPFMLMESTPSMTNWQGVSKLKRPGMHLLASMQAVAHGADTIQYFQWRKSRGSFEKFHGAVVDHCGHENNRVFQDVKQVGEALTRLKDVVGTSVASEVAIVYDWENRWAIDDLKGINNNHKDYLKTVVHHYQAFWQQNIPVDVIDMDESFTHYKVLVAPMLYMLKPGVAERIEAFVKTGGTLITTYLTGFVDDHDLCFLNGFPGPLRKVLGIWIEESDGLYPEDYNLVSVPYLSQSKNYSVKEMCDLIHLETAKPLGYYTTDFYAGRPALTVNEFGEGQAYFIAFRNKDGFQADFYSQLAKNLQLKTAFDSPLPKGVTAQMRYDEQNHFVFLMNFNAHEVTVSLEGAPYEKALLTDQTLNSSLTLPAYGVEILQRKQL